ncbi:MULTISPECIES: alpha/beta fold hydrolase [Ramlibacter]|uniref:Alpha/beta fold hydrolase n=1 Tax=Ramlibacter pinisoli TaxID=2682844 RepID=A0A6N8IY57_9BURK|nr:MULTISPECIES: alpha/beta hydrolase [Ramlibacter]MBA2962008.1 alpha/beta hydrolase [Ramlibacter sp. CGMCC 1.13660]MVQ31951.1 alpha/beta fold hydrolase [Ramlibacter pinisoli]
MTVLKRNNVFVHRRPSGRTPLLFVHGYGCDKDTWRILAPHFAEDRTVVLLDLVGSGHSDLSAWRPHRYATLQGHADDVVEVLQELDLGPLVVVGHSAGAMIGLLVELAAPAAVRAQVMVGPSPCFINDAGYVGGFTRADIESLLETLESNYIGWSSNMAPVIMGAPRQPELTRELTRSFCGTDPEVARQFARATFLCDYRAQLPKLRSPTLILQSSDDLIAPVDVGETMHRAIPRSTLRVIDNVGHCPHLSAPAATVKAIETFLAELHA